MVSEDEGREELTPAQKELRNQFQEEFGYWAQEFDDILRVDPKFFEQYYQLYAHPWRNGPLDMHVKEYIHIAAHSCINTLYSKRTRIHIGSALDRGAPIGELVEVIKLSSGNGMHGIIEGAPILRQATEDSDYLDESTRKEQDRVRTRFETGRNYWSDIWEDVLRLDHEFLDHYATLSSQPWEDGPLDPKIKEFLYITTDVVTTHLYVDGIDVHVDNALKYGATRDELTEVFEHASMIGFDAMIESAPILVEEARRRGVQL